MYTHKVRGIIAAGLAAGALALVAATRPARATDDPFTGFISPISNPVNFEGTEPPVTSRKDIFDWRITTNLIFWLT